MKKFLLGRPGVFIAGAIMVGPLVWLLFFREQPTPRARLDVPVEVETGSVVEEPSLQGQDETRTQYEFEVQEAVPLNWRFRLSALVRSGNEVKAGIIDRANNQSFLLGAGESAGGVLVRSIDYEKESVVVSAGEEEATLVLEHGAGLSDVKEGSDEEPPLYRGAGIEAFMKEHPEAEYKAGSGTPVEEPDVAGDTEKEEVLTEPEQEGEEPYDPAMNMNEGIEGFLQRNPQLDKQAREPAEGLGPEIEKFLQEKAREQDGAVQ